MAVIASDGATLSPDDTRSQSQQDSSRVFAALACALASVVLLQRVYIPVVQVSVTVPVVFCALAYVARVGRLRVDPARAVLGIIALGVCLGSALVSSLDGRDTSILSVLLLTGLYLPFATRVSGCFDVYERLLRFLCNLLVLPALAAVAQSLGQLLGVWAYRDYVVEFLPASLLPPEGAYNTAYPLYYGSDVIKANAFVFLEPSFCSQFMALGILVHLWLGWRLWRVPLLAVAMLCALAGTGILLLAAGIAALAIAHGGRRGIAMFAGALVSALLVLATPAGAVLADRSREFGAEGSSGNARFVLPYVQTYVGLSKDSDVLLWGLGPGSVSREGADYFNPRDLPANYGVVPKLLAEYGLPSAIAFTSFMLMCLVRRTRSGVLSVAAILVYFVLSSSLLQPHTIMLVLLLVPLFSLPWSDPDDPAPDVSAR